jgi:hypothetical protein
MNLVYAYPPSEFLIQEFLEETPHDLPVFYNYHCKNLPENTKFIYYNIEQLTRESERAAILQLWYGGKIVEVWDYSLVNCEILKVFQIPCRHIPFTLTPKRLAKYKALVNVKKEFDVGFCGTLSPRRLKILEELSARVSCLFINGVFDEERDAALAKCKVILNIHYEEDYKIFERSRCQAWMELGVPVVSETSLDDDPRAFCFPYDKLVEETVLIVNGCNYP